MFTASSVLYHLSFGGERERIENGEGKGKGNGKKGSKEEELTLWQ